MDTFMTLLQSYVPHQETQRLVLMGLAGLIVFLFALGVSSLVTVAIDPKRRRLSALTPSSDRDKDKSASFAAWVHSAASYVLPAKGTERDGVQQQLTHELLGPGNDIHSSAVVGSARCGEIRARPDAG